MQRALELERGANAVRGRLRRPVRGGSGGQQAAAASRWACAASADEAVNREGAKSYQNEQVAFDTSEFRELCVPGARGADECASLELGLALIDSGGDGFSRVVGIP